MLIALLLSIPQVAAPVGSAVGVAADKISNTARTVLVVSVGIFLIWAGVAAMAVTVVGVSLIAVGLALVVWGLWPVVSTAIRKKPE